MNDNQKAIEQAKSGTVSQEDFDRLIVRIQQVEQSKADCVAAIESLLKHIYPRESQYSRGLYNGLLTCIGIMTGKNQDGRLCKDSEAEIIIAQCIPLTPQ